MTTTDPRVICDTIENWAAEYDGEPFHALLCDPPYELGFMGKSWDDTGVTYRPETWAMLADHLLPGAFGMAFASARGWHRLAVAIEDAGMILHPSIFGWLYGSGFPKATRIDTQVDEAAGAEREVVARARIDGRATGHAGGWKNSGSDVAMDTAPATDLARTWEGHRYGMQSMKPALEPIILFQKPYQGRPVDSITETGAGALNIEASRVRGQPRNPGFRNPDSVGMWGGRDNKLLVGYKSPPGRWPANVYLDAEAARRLDEMSGERQGCGGDVGSGDGHQGMFATSTITSKYQDIGGASRFFTQVGWQLEQADPVLYCAKASRKEREAGLSRKNGRKWSDGRQVEADHPKQRGRNVRANHHPTVKPIELCEWLARLLLPPDAYAPRRLLVPFAGSGSEMIGAWRVGWEVIVGIEMVAEYADIARARLDYWMDVGVQLALWSDT